MNNLITAVLIMVLTGCAAHVSSNSAIQVDQVPMYGGMKRAAYPELKAADEKLIADTTDHYGTREKAAAAFVNNGFAYYQKDDLVNAMRRFNQAWLLDPMNAEVYAGFGSILHDQGKNCEAMKMMEKALSLNAPTSQGIYPDAARVITLCAVSDNSLSPEDKSKLIMHSEELYIKAEKIEANKRYVYSSWATAYYWRGQYSEAWSMIEKERANGGTPSEKFLGMLREKMPEPMKK